MSARKPRKEKSAIETIQFGKSPLHHHSTDTEAFSDTEAGYGAFRNSARYYPVSSSLPNKGKYSILQDDANLTEGEGNDPRGSLSNDEFGDGQTLTNKIVKTGRQRKKLAARSKGGEFQAKRSKKRVYFCCVASEIDVQNLFDYLVSAGGLLFGWQYHIYNDVLHLYKAGQEDTAPILMNTSKSKAAASHQDALTSRGKHQEYNQETSATPVVYQIEQRVLRPHSQSVDTGAFDAANRVNEELLYAVNDNDHHNGGEGETSRGNAALASDMPSDAQQAKDNPFRITGVGAQEVFVFDFGAVVFWGFSRGEEVNLLKTIRMFVTKGAVGAPEFQSGVDDMAFVTSPDAEGISLANDVITLPDDSVAKQRMSVSFAIAQSSVLSIFEARIERRVEEYKYIPETLAEHGKVHLSERQLGMMIGEVFVIRHDVNLHTEILDTPDFFWKEEKFEQDYRMVMSYLEMSGRTEILNKRLDMLRELLDVLQQQMENAHAVKLEMIVIYLIVVEVVLQVFAIISK